MVPGASPLTHHRSRYASPLTFPRRSARASENALRTASSRPAVPTIVERLFDRVQDAPIHSIGADDTTTPPHHDRLSPPPQEGPTVTGMDQGLLTVGLMAQRSGLTVKALRHYDRVGLLLPETIDSATGYRLYHRGQIAEARLISLLRSLDLPLAQ